MASCSSLASPPWTCPSSGPDTTYVDFGSLVEKSRDTMNADSHLVDGMVLNEGDYSYDDDALFASNCQPLLPHGCCCCYCCCCCLRKVDSEESSTLIFSSPASYHFLTWILLALLPLSTLLGTFTVQYSLEPALSPDQRHRALIGLWSATFAIFAAYFAVLPRRYEVHSDATLRVVTWLIAFELDWLVAAVEDPPLVDVCSYGFQNKGRMRWDVATNFENRVLIRRTGGKWDAVVSPRNVPGLVAAVEKVAVVEPCGDEQESPPVRLPRLHLV